MHIVSWIGLAVWSIAALCWLTLEVVYSPGYTWWSFITRAALAIGTVVLVNIGALIIAIIVLAPLLALLPVGFLSSALAAIGL